MARGHPRFLTEKYIWYWETTSFLLSCLQLPVIANHRTSLNDADQVEQSEVWSYVCTTSEFGLSDSYPRINPWMSVRTACSIPTKMRWQKRDICFQRFTAVVLIQRVGPNECESRPSKCTKSKSTVFHHREECLAASQTRSASVEPESFHDQLCRVLLPRQHQR